MVELKRKILDAVEKMVELVVVGYVVVEYQKAVHGLSSEPRNPAVVDTCWVGLAPTQYLLPSRDGWIPVSNTVLQGSEGVRRETGW